MIVFIDYVIDHLFEICRMFDTSRALDAEAIRDFGKSAIHTHLSPPASLGLGSGPRFWASTVACDWIALTLFLYQHTVKTSNSPAVPLILSTITRHFMSHGCRGLKTLVPFTQSAIAHPPSPLTPYFDTLRSVLRSCTISPNNLEAILTSMDQFSKSAYSSMTDAQRSDIELRVLTGDEIPEACMTPLGQTLAEVVNKSLRLKNPDAETDLAFRDWRILGLGDDKISKSWRRETVFDAVRKFELGPEVKIKRCVRCGSVMEDLPSAALRNVQWLGNMMRMCFCGGAWYLEGGNSERGNE